MVKSVLAAVAFALTALTAGQAGAAINVSWADLNSTSASGVSGVINAPSGTVGVSFTGAYTFAQINNAGTDYWVVPGSNPYTGGAVNRPSTVDMVALDQGGSKTITFSQAVTDVYMAFTSWNGNNASFSSPFTIIGQGCGYWGCGTFSPNATNTAFFGVGETSGVLQFQGVFTSLTFTDTSEGWHGFTVGIGDVAGAGVPEPGTWALLLTGIGGLGAALRRRRELALA
jgi:hypothetical protein